VAVPLPVPCRPYLALGTFTVGFYLPYLRYLR
jgi:hypothetical protein